MPNNLLVTKIKNLDEHIAKNWTPIKFNLESNSIWILQFLHSTSMQPVLTHENNEL